MAAVRIVSQNSVLHIKWCRWLLAFLSFLVSQTTNEANHYFFSWSNLNTKDWNQGYKKDFHFEVLPCFWEKASRRISQAIGGVQRIWEEFHSVPPACTQVWEFQSQVTNTRDYRRTLHMQWLFEVRPELTLLLQDERSNSKGILFIDTYSSPPSQHEQRTIDFPTWSAWQSSNFYRA